MFCVIPHKFYLMPHEVMFENKMSDLVNFEIFIFKIFS